MICIKCKSDVPDGKYCLKCGASQTRTVSRRQRANGMGTAYRRGKTWTACVIIGWNEDNEKKKSIPVKRTKGGFKTKRDALAYCASLKQPTELRKTATIKQLFETYEITGFTKISASRQTAYKIAYNKISSIHHTNIAALSIDILQDLISDMSYYTARDIKTLLSHLYTLACAEQVVSVNLSRYMALPDLIEDEPQPFPDEDLKKLWAAYESGDIWIGYILLMIYSGMMPGELLKCRKGMIDIKNRRIVGAGLKTKERKTNPIAIADFIVPVINSLLELSSSDKLVDMKRNNFYLMYHDKLIQYGVTDLPPYSCRHTTATALAIGKNISPLLIQRIMRHANLSSTQKYIHFSTDDSVGAINKLRPTDNVPTT